MKAVSAVNPGGAISTSSTGQDVALEPWLVEPLVSTEQRGISDQRVTDRWAPPENSSQIQFSVMRRNKGHVDGPDRIYRIRAPGRRVTLDP